MKGAAIQMRNMEAQITKMHARAAEIKRRADRTRTKIFGTVSAALAVCLVFVVHQLQRMGHGIMAGQNTGSSMLSDSVGGYVLIAVIAFIAGTAITAVIIRHRKK